MTPDVGISLFVFCGVAVGTYWIFVLFDPYRMRVRKRIRQRESPRDARNCDLRRSQREMAGIPSLVFNRLNRLNPYHTTDRSNLQTRLAKAGIYNLNAIAWYFGAKVLFTILPGAMAIAAVMTGILSVELSVAVTLIVAGIGSLLPGLWLDRAIARHHLLLRKSLPDFIDLMTVCLEGGLSLQEAIRRVTDELRLAHPALALELGIVQRDVELGATVDQALKRFGTRADYEGVRTLSTFIREAQRFGTNIASALRSHAEMLRAQREQSAEESAQKASVKILLPTLLLIFPAIFVVLVAPAIIQIQEAFATK